MRIAVEKWSRNIFIFLTSITILLFLRLYGDFRIVVSVGFAIFLLFLSIILSIVIYILYKYVIISIIVIVFPKMKEKAKETIVITGISFLLFSIIFSISFNIACGVFNSGLTNFNKVIIYEYKGNDTDLVIPNRILFMHVTKIGKFAFRNKNITNVILPNKLIKIYSSAFENNYITNITLPNSLQEIDSNAFKHNKIKEITISDSLQRIGPDAFGNNLIEDLILPNSLLSIGAYAFSYNNIKEIIIPDSVKEINTNAFSNNLIEKVTIGNNVNVNGSYIFGGGLDLQNKGYVPEGSVWIEREKPPVYNEQGIAANVNEWEWFLQINGDFVSQYNENNRKAGIYYLKWIEAKDIQRITSRPRIRVRRVKDILEEYQSLHGEDITAINDRPALKRPSREQAGQADSPDDDTKDEQSINNEYTWDIDDLSLNYY